MAQKPNGYVLWQGVSSFDGSPIAVIATGLESKSTNAKTGAMVQTYILRTDVNPVEAVKTGQDVSICGDCRHRPTLAAQSGEARCYVNVGQGALAVYKAFKQGKYPAASVSDIAPLLKGRKVRFGTYGDPAVAPVQVFADLAKVADGHTGYTHRWRDQSFDVAAWSPLVMASVDDLWEQQTAKALGLRYFRVTIGVTELLDREVRCPASAEMGKRTTCVSCTLCSGTTTKAKSVVIADHGLGWKSRAKA
jgi:hypothetical protein